MKWQFSEYPIDMVEMEVTQRDQFRNDEVDLADTLIRETVQNSLDARIGGSQTVTVRFGFLNGPDGLDPVFIKSLFEGQLDHAKAADVSVDSIDFDHPFAIVIEDFGTRGLQGNPYQFGNDDFSDFWRRHGISHKTGGSRGRWGLGKLVFSTSSRLQAFFGLTVPEGTDTPLLMGQTVLRVHTLGEKKYQAHTHFSEISETESTKSLRIPITEQALIDKFTTEFLLQRKTESGLSLIIPFPHHDLERSRMIAAAIRHYFIPILRGQLIIKFDDLVLDSGSIQDCAHKYLPANAIHDVDELFAFVGEADSNPTHIDVNERWYRDGLEQAISAEMLDQMRQTFSNGDLLSIRFPVDLARKDGSIINTEFKGYLKKPANLSRGQDYYVRSGITVPAETKFGQRKALGLLLADDTGISEFLGDAENPAHTQWIGKSEKAQKNYKAPETRVAAIKKCLLNLHDLLAQAVEEKAEDALLDFFWTPGTGTGPRKGKGTVVFPPIPPKPPELKPFRVSSQPGGFVVRPGTGLTNDMLPVETTIRVAYDVDDGNPFKLYSTFDFDFAKTGDAEIVVNGVDMVGATGNVIRCIVKETDFKILVTDLDNKRDLIVCVEGA